MINARQSNIKIIRAIKERLNKIPLIAVAKKLDIAHQNIYYYLNETRAEKANIEMLTRITEAIEEVEKEQIQKAKNLIATLTK